MEEFMKAEAFDEALERIWNEFLFLHNRLSEEAAKELQELIIHHKEDMDDASYLRVMYMKGIAYEPVSYTHLDVYKRQVVKVRMMKSWKR